MGGLTYKSVGWVRRAEELKKEGIYLDFRSDKRFIDQIREEIINNFRFTKFDERHKIIDRVLNPNRKHQELLSNVIKHVLIRNAIKHRNGVVDSYILENLGCAGSYVTFLDDKGKLRRYKEGDKIELSFPAIHEFKRSILRIAQLWKGGEVK